MKKHTKQPTIFFTCHKFEDTKLALFNSTLFSGDSKLKLFSNG